MENKYNEDDIVAFLKMFETFPTREGGVQAREVFPKCAYYLAIKEYDQFLKEMIKELAGNSAIYSNNYKPLMTFIFTLSLADMPLYINKANISLKDVPDMYDPKIAKTYTDKYIDLYKAESSEVFSRVANWRIQIGK